MSITRDSSLTPAASAAARALAAGSTAFLFVAPFASSAGLRAAMLVVCAIALCVRGGETLEALRDFPRDVAIAALAWIALAVASLAWSLDPAYTRGELKAEMLYGALAFTIFYVAGRLDRSLWRPWWIAAIAGTVTTLAGQALQAVAPFEIENHDVDGGSGPFSTQLVLLMPLLFALDWPAPWGFGHRLRLLAFSLCALFAAAWSTESRIVWVAFAVQVVVAIAAWRRLPESAARHASALRALAVIAVVVTAIAFAASIAERDERNLLHPSGVAPGLTHDLRPRIWAVAWDHFLDAPWLGHGFGREILGAAFKPLTPEGGKHPVLLHGHDTFIDMALELGVAGLAAFVALLAALARRYLAMLRTESLAPLGIAGLALLAGFAVKNLTDDFLHRHNALVFWSLNAMLLGLSRSREAPR